MKDIFSAS